MVAPILIASAYFCACFFAAALQIRFLPNSFAARCVDRHFWLFAFWPFLCVVDLFGFTARTVGVATAGSKTVFDKVAGRTPRSGIRKSFGYFAYGSPRSLRKTSGRPPVRTGGNATRPKRSA